MSSIKNKKISRYIYYAFGEIFLVTIGILIALQINNWNNNRLDIKKEASYLNEIKENLNDDLLNLQTVLDFNKKKKIAIDSSFYYLAKMNEDTRFGKNVSSFMPILTDYSAFKPTNVAFNNMTSSGNIDLIRNDSIRKTLSTYYALDPLEGIQDQLKDTSKKFLEYSAPEMINQEMMYALFKENYDIHAVADLKIHKDREVLSDLFVMNNKMIIQNRILEAQQRTVKTLIASIENYLN